MFGHVQGRTVGKLLKDARQEGMRADAGAGLSCFTSGLRAAQEAALTFGLQSLTEEPGAEGALRQNEVEIIAEERPM